jgi:NAD(P)-dependent dehydrogenase (short-subunit alcohol dehydrogenase family)
LPMEQWRRVFEVNLFGHIAVTQALLPALLRSKGRVINISSIGGRAAMATYGAYAGAKFALEAVSDSLRREVAPLGVHVVVVEPGGVRTEMATRGVATANDLAARMTPEQVERYGSLVQANNALMTSGTSSGLTADAAARIIVKAVTTRRPRARYTAGRDAAMIIPLTRILSDRTLDRILAANLRRHYPKQATA